MKQTFRRLLPGILQRYQDISDLQGQISVGSPQVSSEVHHDNEVVASYICPCKCSGLWPVDTSSVPYLYYDVANLVMLDIGGMPCPST